MSTVKKKTRKIVFHAPQKFVGYVGLNDLLGKNFTAERDSKLNDIISDRHSDIDAITINAITIILSPNPKNYCNYCSK